MTPITVLDVVVLREDAPALGLARGQVGTVVEQLAMHMCEVEFADDEGRTYAEVALPANALLVARHPSVGVGET